MGPLRRSDCLAVVILPHISHTSRESLFVDSSAHSGRPGTNGDIDGAVSIYPPPSVYECTPLLSGTALLLGSWIGVILGLFIGGMLANRAVREERVLQEGLEGYDAYMAQVR